MDGDKIMNMTRCKRAHYYDKDKFVECPHCAMTGVLLGVTDSMSQTGESITEERKIHQPQGEAKSLRDAVRNSMELKRMQEYAASSEEIVAEQNSMSTKHNTNSLNDAYLQRYKTELMKTHTEDWFEPMLLYLHDVLDSETFLRVLETISGK